MKSKLDIAFEKALADWLESRIHDMDYSDFDGFICENFAALQDYDELIEHTHDVLERVKVKIEFSDY